MSAARTKAGAEPALGIIGGSGLYEMEGIEDLRWVRVRTPFGEASDQFGTGRFGDRPVIFLPRHGRGHRLSPTEINYRANVWGLKALGARWVVSVSAVGSMKEDIHPLDLVIPAQFVDLTKRRVSSFFGDGIVAHVGMAHPVCGHLADLLEKAAHATGGRVHRGGTYVCIEGPQFSTLAEAHVHRQLGFEHDTERPLVRLAGDEVVRLERALGQHRVIPGRADVRRRGAARRCRADSRDRRTRQCQSSRRSCAGPSARGGSATNRTGAAGQKKHQQQQVAHSDSSLRDVNPACSSSPTALRGLAGNIAAPLGGQVFARVWPPNRPSSMTAFIARASTVGFFLGGATHRGASHAPTLRTSI